MSHNGETGKTRRTERVIGMWGTLARLAVGAVLLAVAFVVGVGWDDAAIGLVGFPAAVMLVLAIRGRAAAPLRFFGSRGHLINGVIVVAAFVLLTPAALLFYGASMLLAGTRGYAGCEVFALSNWLWRRDDQIACAIFSPIDAIEGRAHSC
jgi:hypothetical protein